MSIRYITASKKAQIERLALTIFQRHGCDATWIESLPFGKRPDMEVFALIGHPKAQLCFAWSRGEPEQFIIVLKIPPVVDAESAFEAARKDKTISN
jgi:hypothetical protein